TVFYSLITLVVINELLLCIGNKIFWPVVQASSNSEISFIQNDYDADKTKCIQSLLVNRNRIPDKAFNATSEVLDPSGAKRYNAHSIRNENTDFAWCPGKRIGTECDEYIEVDMGELNIITKVVISGLLAEDGGSRYTPYFYIRYKREQNEENWRTYRQLRPTITSRLLGGLDALVPKFVVLDPPLIARWIRIYPYRDPPGFVCIRLEAYGCQFSDDLVEYRIPEGSLAHPPYQAETHLYKVQGSELFTNEKQNFSQAGGGLPFSDTCYDGHRIEPGSLLNGGLGCLIDLNIANRDATPLIQRGLKADKSMNHQFVGWHRDRWRSSQEKNNDVVDMLFRFASIRNFTRLRFYVSNNYLEKVRIPRRLEVKFSVGGVHFSGQSPISRDFKLENRSVGVFSITMDLSHRIGQVVQLKAFFADDWLLFSEIRFESEKVTTPVKLDESAVIPAKSSNNPMNNNDKEEDVVNTENGADTKKVPPSNDAVLDDSPTRLSTVVILVLVLLCCFLGLLAGVACFSVTWMHRKRHDLEREKHQVHKTLLIRGEDGLNAYTTGLRGNGDVVVGSAGGAYTTIRPNMYPFLLSGAKPDSGVSTVLPNGGLQSYHQMVLSSNTSAESSQSCSNDKNPSQQQQQQQQQQHQISKPGVGILVDQSNTIANRLSDGTTGPSDGITSETEAFCDNKFDDENHLHRHVLYDHHNHYSQQRSSLLSSLLCMSKMRRRRKRCSSSFRANRNKTISNNSTNTTATATATTANIQGNINCKEIENNTHNNNNSNLGHTEFFNGVKDFPIVGQLASKSQPGHDTGLCSNDLLNAHIRGQTSVQTANGLLQIDLSHGHPSMLINGQPLIRIPASSNPTNITDNSWLIHQTTGYRNNNAVGMNLMNTEPGVYTTVGGTESDIDSNAASTMSPEYASASMVHDYPGLAATLAQLNQQRLAAALAAMNNNNNNNNVQSNLHPCSNLSSSSSINFNLFTNPPPLNSPFDHNLNSNIVGPKTSANNATSNNNNNNGYMNNFLTSVNTIQHPLLFSNPHSLHDMLMLTTTSTTAVPTNLLNGVQSSTGNNNNNILSHNGFLVDTDSSSNYGAVDIDRIMLKQQHQQQQSQQQNQQIYEAYNLPSPSAPVYYPAHHPIMSSTPLVISSISQQPMVPLSVTKVSNNNNNTNNNSNNNIANNSTLVGRGFSNNDYKSSKQEDLDIGQLKHLSDMNKTDFNSKSTLTTNNCLPNSNYRVSDHNPWIKASNLNRYDTEQQQQQPHQHHQRRQHENLLLKYYYTRFCVLRSRRRKRRRTRINPQYA
ncbi:unnamed protein product, partial [Trichobilharzia szidati]